MQVENSKEVVIFHDDEIISKAIVTLLENNIGYSINIFGVLGVRQLDDLTFAVSHEKYDSEAKSIVFDYEMIFDDAKEATDFFLQKRFEHELGADFEIEPK